VTRVMLTGATGFVGGRVAERLRQRGDHVVAPVRRRTEVLEGLGVEQHVAALTDIDALRRVLDGADGVVHAAATAGDDLEAVRAVNRDGTRAVVDAALAVGTPRLVHLSTVSVYDLDAVPDGLVTEDAPLQHEDSGGSSISSASSPYGITKAEAEAEVARGTASGLSTIVLRIPAVLGAGPTSTWGTRVPRRYRDGDLPPRPPATTFAWIHVEDLVDVTLAALDHDATGRVNVIGGHTTFGAYLHALRDAVPSPPAVAAASPAEPWRGRFTSDRLRRTLGIEPRRTFEEAMAEIVAAWRDPDQQSSDT
jgi:2-alkyl-3-oxoalkanoate reductase